VLIVTGSVRARSDAIDEMLELSVQHVHRSRTEPGCLLHSVSRDAEDPWRFVFLEHWVDADALRAHFRVPASGHFVAQLAGLADGAPTLEIYEAQPITL
jgi:quinol monooxygenase YgiN